MKTAALLAATAALAAVPFVAAQEPAKPPTPVIFGKEFVERKDHKMTLAGKEFAYYSMAGMLPLHDDDEKVTANVFFVSYTKAPALRPDKSTDPIDTTRPVVFFFNGGPGSSSVWLHLGAFGPKRVQFTNEAGEAPPPPSKLIENEFTALAQADLVFIDPVSTGFSKAEKGTNAKLFHGVNEDLGAVGEFIRLYLVRYGRWASPKFLCGESYGTTRAAGLADHLQQRHGIDLNGVMLVSSVLNFQTLRFDDGNDLPFTLYVPSYAAVAWYQGKLPPELKADLKKTLAEVEQFAATEYTLALNKGEAITPEERAAVAKKLARYTGLSEEYVLRANLRIDVPRFCKELLRDRRATVGRYDGRLQGADRDAAGERPEYDPSYAAVQTAFTTLINNYLRNELKYEMDRPYEVLTSKVQPWEYGPAKNRYLNVAPSLRSAMTQNRSLKVFVASGLFDLATPYYATDYTFRHLGLEGGNRDRVTFATYEAGHMMYTHLPSLRKLRADTEAFITAALPK